MAHFPCHDGPADKRCDSAGRGGFMGHTCLTLTPSPFVVIYSDEYGAYWRTHAQGYTTDINEAGVWARSVAERLIEGIGPEKKVTLRAFDGERVVANDADGLDREALTIAALAAWCNVPNDNETVIQCVRRIKAGDAKTGGDPTWRAWQRVADAVLKAANDQKKARAA